MRVELTAALLEMDEPADEISTLLGHSSKSRHSWVIARGISSAYRSIVRGRSRYITLSPANRIIMTTEPGESVRDILLNLPDDLRDDVLASHGIPREAMDRLAAGDDEGFIEVRRDFLAERERVFMARYGLVAPPGEGETDIDTE
ncbi:hypothetical protein [Actinomadura formosensis]|uniref:hypothetical protein n=1 Tax=Actinomadura formosensis TaxID=60706 RepID=UPI003D8A3EB6